MRPQRKPDDAWHKPKDVVLVGLNEADNVELFEIGTINLDDYYPSFHFTWAPQGLTRVTAGYTYDRVKETR